MKRYSKNLKHTVSNTISNKVLLIVFHTVPLRSLTLLGINTLLRNLMLYNLISSLSSANPLPLNSVHVTPPYPNNFALHQFLLSIWRIESEIVLLQDTLAAASNSTLIQGWKPLAFHSFSTDSSKKQLQQLHYTLSIWPTKTPSTCQTQWFTHLSPHQTLPNLTSRDLPYTTQHHTLTKCHIPYLFD